MRSDRTAPLHPGVPGRGGYNAWRNFVSTLSLGNQGWEQITNFLVCGLLVLCFAVGLRWVLRSGKSARWGPILVGGFGLGQVVAGLFVTGPSISFFPATPGITPNTIYGVTGLVVFATVSAACFVLARRFANDPAWTGTVALCTILLLGDSMRKET